MIEETLLTHLSTESLIISNLLFNSEYSRRVLPYLYPELFEDFANQYIFKQVKHFITNYNTIPTIETLVITIKNDKLTENVYDETLNRVINLKSIDSDQNWLISVSEKWARDRAIYLNYLDMIEIYEGTSKETPDSLIASLIKAVHTTFTFERGHSYKDDAEKQYQYYIDPVFKLPFSIEIFNLATNNGVPRKTLNIVQAGINVGKTTKLLNITDMYLDQGLNGVYFSGELPEEVIRERLDVCSLGITSPNLRKMSKTNYLNKVVDRCKRMSGDVIIKEFKAGRYSAANMRHYLNQLKTQYNFVPDFICIDYLTLVASELIPASKKGDSNTYFTSVAEEIRALASEFNCVIWTATQFTRTGQNTDNPTLSDMGLSIGIAASADFIIGLTADKTLVDMKQCLCHVLKNRFGNRNRYNKFILGLDNDLQRFYGVVGGDSNHESEESNAMAKFGNDLDEIEKKDKKVTLLDKVSIDFSGL